MIRKSILQWSLLFVMLMMLLALPAGVAAGGMCGGVYVVEAGETLASLAAKCGMTTSAIIAANPGVSDPLFAGQSLNLSGIPAGSGSVTVVIVGTDPIPVNPPPPPAPRPHPAPMQAPVPPAYSGVHIVQMGETFMIVAGLYGLSIDQLWGANPQVWNINYIYAGQPLNIPPVGYVYPHPSQPYYYYPTPTQQPASPSNGYVPEDTEYKTIQLVNQSNSKNIYISLQGTLRNGTGVIREYSVARTLTVEIPSGSYKYVTWANGKQIVGYFELYQNPIHTLTIYNDRGSAK